MLRVLFHVLLGSSCLLAGAASPPDAGDRETAPVQRRADALFEILRSGNEEATKRYIERELDDAFLDLAPLEVHLEQFAMIRDSLGAFEVEEVRLTGPDRGEFILRTGEGEAIQLDLELEPIPPFRVAGLGLHPYDPDSEVPDFADLDEVAAWLERMEQAGKFSGVIQVTRRQQPDWIRAFGPADRSRAIPNRPGTRFDVGSITKAFTAVAVMQLVQQGKVDLEAPMGRYLEGFRPEIADRVRVIDLLRMESGFGDYYTAEFEKRRLSMREVSDFLEFFKTMELEFEPGTQRRYSNVGYVLLGGIVEKASGIRFARYVRERIYRPAGMRGSDFRDIESDDPRAAIGYTRMEAGEGEGYATSNRAWLDPKGSPAGGSFSPAGDLVRFVRALRGRQLLDESGTRLVMNFFERADELPAVYAVAGGAPGVSAVLLDDAGAGVTVVVLSNYDEPLAERIGTKVFEMLREGAPATSDEPDPSGR